MLQSPLGSSEAGRAPDPQVPDDNVIGGTPIEIETKPWTVAVKVKGIADNWCGGVLIGATTVMTAAHCVDTTKIVGSRSVMGPNILSVVAGRSELDDESKGKVIGVTKVWISDRYVPYHWDYAILELAEPVVGPDADSKLGKLNIVKVAGPLDDKLWKPGVELTAVGWGCQKPGAVDPCEDPGGSPLSQTKLRVQTTDKCAAMDFDTETGTGLCLASDSGTTTVCNGDSGGPYVVQAADNLWYLVGLVSYGFVGCGPDRTVVAALVPRLMASATEYRSDVHFVPCTENGHCKY